MTASPSGGTSGSDVKAHLRQLKECLDEGLLTQEEYDREKLLALQAARANVG